MNRLARPLALSDFMLSGIAVWPHMLGNISVRQLYANNTVGNSPSKADRVM